MCFFNATWIKCAVIAICDLSGFPLLERHEGIAVGDSLYAELQLEYREAAYTRMHFLPLIERG